MDPQNNIWNQDNDNWDELNENPSMIVSPQDMTSAELQQAQWSPTDFIKPQDKIKP